MFDFVKIKSKVDDKKKTISVYPSFQVMRSKDFMTKGKTFYAIWDEAMGVWSLDETTACYLIDKEIDNYANELRDKKPDYDIHEMKLLDYKSRQYTEWQSYCKAIPDNYKQLDNDITFLNERVEKEDYRSKRLNYIMEDVPTPNWDELVSTLYDEDERRKIEWAIGSIIAGDSKNIQKFYVLYGEPGSGKSTILKVIGKLFEGYTATFDAKAVGNPLSTFALEPFKDNPLIAIQDDGDLYHIEDNTRLNSIASHEPLNVNEKHKSIYTIKFNSVMFIGTNKPVRITDAKSGVIRRLIDISPSGRRLKRRRYDAVMEQIDFELGGIAYHCYEVYKNLGKSYFDTYRPVNMIGITNDFYNFVDDNLEFFMEHNERIQLKRVWQLYKDYCVEANNQYPFTLKAFKEELKSYYKEYYDRNNGERKVYCNFKSEIFDYKFQKDKEHTEDDIPSPFVFDQTESLFDKLYSDAIAQYGNKDGKPLKKWDEVTTKLSDLDTHKLHYVLLPEEHIVIDFDLKNENGEKDFEKNLAAASKFPPTYAELSKSGAGIHLHYIYTGDPKELSRIYDEDIEVKVFTGKSSLRRCLTKCNNLPIAKISSGLKLKGDKPMVNFEAMKSEKQLRALIRNCLLKKHHGATKPEVDYIYDTLEKCYKSGMHYDVTDMRPDITAFATDSTHQALACLKLVSQMKFKSEEPSQSTDDGEAPIIFLDCEVFPNLFVVCWKFQGEGKQVVKMINPSPSDIEKLLRFRIIGHNVRGYDNHILYARTLGYSNEELFKLSSRIVNGNKQEENRNCFFSEAYNLSYADTYDYASNDNRMSLKKWEIKLGLHHLENEHAWDEPVDEEYWEEIADYCANDVVADEAVFNATQADFKARLILAELSGLTPNDKTNSHTIRLICGNDKNPQSHYIYPDLSKEFPGYEFNEKGTFPDEKYNKDAKLVKKKSYYLGEDPSEGGYAWGNPGIYTNVELYDIASMHPSTIIFLNLFGDKYTANFKQLVDLRLHIKHKEYDVVREMFDGKLAKYLTSDEDAKALSTALKIAINSVYGLTSAKFANKLRDPRNVDNVVAKRGALFMIKLKHECQARGWTVVHCKTDSIKLANATKEMRDFVFEFGKKYGYTFEHEATYEKMCILNHAVYVAKYSDGKHKFDELPTGEEIMTEWTATGEEFKVPYVFKTLFSHTPLNFKDYCETFNVQKGTLYLDMNENLPDVSAYEKELQQLGKKNNEDYFIPGCHIVSNDDNRRILELANKINEGHSYKFIGRVGEFVPIERGKGGGELMVCRDHKYTYASGSKGYRWLDSETVKAAGYEKNIDKNYFRALVDESIAHIQEFGDFDWFVSDDKQLPPPNNLKDTDDLEVPFDEDFKAMNPPA